MRMGWDRFAAMAEGQALVRKLLTMHNAVAEGKGA